MKVENLLPAIYLASILLSTGCKTPSPIDPRVQREWSRHEEVIAVYVKGEAVSFEEFASACRFFREVTGIDARVDWGYAGMSPSKDTPDDLRKWREWYRKNRLRLYWDEDLGQAEYVLTN